jgi:hypothetical protein
MRHVEYVYTILLSFNNGGSDVGGGVSRDVLKNVKKNQSYNTIII